MSSRHTMPCLSLQRWLFRQGVGNECEVVERQARTTVRSSEWHKRATRAVPESLHIHSASIVRKTYTVQRLCKFAR